MSRILILVLFCLALPTISFAGTHTKKNQFILPFTITVQPGTFLPTQVASGSSVHAIYKITNNNHITANNAKIVSLPRYASVEGSGCGAGPSFTLAPGQSCTLTLNFSAVGLLPGTFIDGGAAPNVLMACWSDGVSCRDYRFIEIKSASRA